MTIRAPGAARTDTAVGVSTAPERSGLVLMALILVAAVANMNLAVAWRGAAHRGPGVQCVADRA